MKPLNLFAVFGAGPIHQNTGLSLTHYPLFQDDAGVQYVHLNGDFRPLAGLKISNQVLIRIEPANLGN
jgi:hypothetical protein